MITNNFLIVVKTFNFMNIWMIAKNSKKNYLKKGIGSHLNMEDITDADYTPTKRVCKDFEIKI